MNILLTNDDGIHANGLWAMERVLSQQHDVSVVAPNEERSAVGHSITLHNPLRVSKVETNGGWGYATNGTPADCVKLAVLEILKMQPDMVISGINPGHNAGINLNYSGTVSAAKEAALMGIPAIAVSEDHAPAEEHTFAAHFVSTLVSKLQERGLPSGTFLNVNIPACLPDKIEGVCITRQASTRLGETFHRRVDPRNQPYYWQGVETQTDPHEPDTDTAALCKNCISITPVQCDMTDYSAMEQLRSWNIKLNKPGPNL